MTPRELSAKRALWLVPLLLTLHDAEEALTTPKFHERTALAMPGPIGAAIAAIAPQQFVGALLIVTLVPYVAALAGNLERPRSPAVVVLLAIQSCVLVNVFWHLAAAVIVRGYTPGLLTAVAVNLPFSIYLLRCAWNQRWATRKQLAGFLVLGLALHALPIAWVAWR